MAQAHALPQLLLPRVIGCRAPFRNGPVVTNLLLGCGPAVKPPSVVATLLVHRGAVPGRAHGGIGALGSLSDGGVGCGNFLIPGCVP